MMTRHSSKSLLAAFLLGTSVLQISQALSAVDMPMGSAARVTGGSMAGGLNRKPAAPFAAGVARQNLGLRGGAPQQAPDVKHVIMVGSVCAIVLILNEVDLLSVVIRVGLTFVLAIIFLLAGINKTTDTFHKPTHLFLANMFPDICKKVWGPIVEQGVNRCLGIASMVYPGLKALCGYNGKSFSLAAEAAAKVTPSNLMNAIGYVEMWSAMFLLISLAGTGSRGYRVPLAELSNMVLLLLMVGAVYTHVVLNDGHFIPPAILAGLLLVRLATPAPSGKRRKGSKGEKGEKGGKSKGDAAPKEKAEKIASS